MKRLFILSLSLCLLGGLAAQPWAPFQVGDTCLLDRASTGEYDHTVWISDVEVVVDAEIRSFNPSHHPCDTCAFWSQVVLWEELEFLEINTPYSFGSSMRVEKGGRYLFGWKGMTRQVLLMPEEPLGSTWLMDTAAMVFATVTAEFGEEVFGEKDLFKIITLSTGDSILLSRDHGLISFPDSLTHGETMSLIGIENRGLGKHVLDFWEIYDFQVGDVLFYDYGHGSEIGFFSNLAKVTVLGRQRVKDTIRFEVDMEGIAGYSNSWYNVPYRESGFSLLDTWTFVRPDNDPADGIPGQLGELLVKVSCFYGALTPWLANPRAFHHDSCMVAPILVTDSTKEVKDFYMRCNVNQYGLNIPDSLTLPAHLIPRTSTYYDIAMKFERGLGQTYYQWSGFEGGEGVELIGYIRDGDTVGSILTEEDLHVSVDQESLAGSVLMYPNPASSQFSLQVSQPQLLPASLTVFDMRGKAILVRELTSSESVISIGDLPPGIYIVQVSAPGRAAFREKLLISEKG
ncbi:MAG: T9SS type A sorting domain-containing protein [Bacteroidia bacterium]|nr:T9SS type A sorting domain-containing protein [Bacteroidia bacterium]